jgi:hypothetical protein
LLAPAARNTSIVKAEGQARGLPFVEANERIAR